MKKVHLSEIENAENMGQELGIEVIITGKGDTVMLPNKFMCFCSGYKMAGPTGIKQTLSLCNNCPYYGKEKLIEIDAKDPLLPKMLNQSDEQIKAIAKKHFSEPTPLEYDNCKSNLSVKLEDSITVRLVQVAPKILKLSSDIDTGERLVDQSGKEYKEQLVYIAGNHLLDKGDCTLIGKPFPLPSNRRISFWATDVEANTDKVDNFKLDDSTMPILSKLVPDRKDPKGIDIIFKKILSDLSVGITKIYGSHHEYHGLGAVLLTYASPTDMYFDEQFLKRAVLNTLIVGDTGQGKSSMVEKFVDSIQLGVMVNGGTAGRTGLLYNLDSKQENGRILRWGQMPLNSGRLVVVDEAQRFTIEDWAEMTRARSESKIEVNKSQRGEHEMKTRLIFIGNPKDKRNNSYKQVMDYIYGIESALIMNEQDLRRFDIVIIIAAGDATQEEVMRLSNKDDLQDIVYTADLMATWIYWVWSKNYVSKETIIYHDSSEEEIVRTSKRLMEKYRVDSMPLLIEDTKEKVARLSAAIANLVPFVVDDKVHIHLQHVQWVEQWLDSNYCHQSNSLDKYAAKQKAISELSDEEYEKISHAISAFKDEIGYEIVKQFEFTDFYISSGLADVVGMTKSNLQNTYIPEFRKMGLLRTAGHGYRRTPKMVRFIKRHNS